MPSTNERRSSAQTRERVLEVTHELFYWHGIHATGVDAVASAAEVAPTTLTASSVQGRPRRRLRRTGGSPTGNGSTNSKRRSPGAPAPIDLFAALDEQLQPENCRGCPFLMALAEILDESDPAHRHAVALKAWVNKRFGELVRELTSTVADPDQLADALTLIFEGSYASAQALGASGPARRSREIVAAMLEPVG